MNFKLIFHYISYLQYPLMIAALIFQVRAFLPFPEIDFSELNNLLVMMGLGISFSTLQDTTKTQNEFSRKMWENPKKGKAFLTVFSIVTAIAIIFGLVSYFFVSNPQLKELSIGFVVLGIGCIGMLKAAIEMFENHRKDKNP